MPALIHDKLVSLSIDSCLMTFSGENACRESCDSQSLSQMVSRGMHLNDMATE